MHLIIWITLCRPHTTYLPLPSSWAPVSKFSYKPWLNEHDSEDVFFSSIHLYAGENFYPCAGDEQQNDDNMVNICLTPIEPKPWNRVAASKLAASKKEHHCAQASEEFR